MPLAVNIVLLPPTSVADRAMELNRTFPDSDPIRLNGEDCLPHISLFMGILQESGQKDLHAALEEIAARTPPLELSVDGVRIHGGPGRRRIAMWSIRKSAELQQLHESIMEFFTPMTQGPASAEHFHSPPPVGASSVSWVQHYSTQSAFEKFDPHITLGYGETGQPGESFSFRPQSLALCHLGASCTCRSILAEVPLD